MAGAVTVASASSRNVPSARGRTVWSSYSASVHLMLAFPEKTVKWFIQNHVICSRSCDGDCNARIRCRLEVS